MVSRAIGRPLTWETDDLALQNIQARVRSPSVWLLANLRGALLLADQQSERGGRRLCHDGRRHVAAASARSPASTKPFCAAGCGGSRSTGPEGIGPIPALAAVNRQAADGRAAAAAAGQTDEADLMPYELLDAIERAAIRDKLTAAGSLSADAGRIPAIHAEQQLALGRAILSALVPQSMETRAVRPVVPRGR